MRCEENALNEFYDKHLNKAITLFKKEPLLPTVAGQRIAVIGDTHGCISVLNKILVAYPPKSTDGPDGFVLVFLGDYVDRSDTCSELLAVLLIEKMRNPESVILLRGDHESPIGSLYPQDFPDEFEHKVGNKKALALIYSALFKELPVAADVNVLDRSGKKVQEYFAVHGGIPIDAPKIAALRKLPRLADPADNEEVLQCLWNDPNNMAGHVESPRGAGYLFGQDEAAAFIEKNHLNAVLRAHQHGRGGFVYDAKTCVFSIQTTLSDAYPGDKPYIAVLTADRIEIDDLSGRLPAKEKIYDVDVGCPVEA